LCAFLVDLFQYRAYLPSEANGVSPDSRSVRIRPLRSERCSQDFALPNSAGDTFHLGVCDMCNVVEKAKDLHREGKVREAIDLLDSQSDSVEDSRGALELATAIENNSRDNDDYVNDCALLCTYRFRSTK
jgi:hypothetical protein